MQVRIHSHRNPRKKYTRQVSTRRISRTHTAKYTPIDSAPNIDNVPGIKFKTNEEFANADICNICKQPFNQQRGVNRHHWYPSTHSAASARAPPAESAAANASTTKGAATSASSNSTSKNRNTNGGKTSDRGSRILSA